MLIESDKVNKRGVLKKAKLNFCDLAGSEKYDKENHMVSDHIRELTQINKSLSVLGKVIHSLGTGKSSHIPYRDSKLTRLLQDSLGVNTRTILIATISPAPQYVEESISTLKFADRAKQVMVKIKKNEISATNDQLITKLQREIQHLKTLLNLKRKGGIQELEQKIWVLTEENHKLKTIKHEFTAEEVERLKEENKKLRIELQSIAVEGKSDGFYIPPTEEYTPTSSAFAKIESPNETEGNFNKPLESPRSSKSGLPPKPSKHEGNNKEVANMLLYCAFCKSAKPCRHKSATPTKEYHMKREGPYYGSPSTLRKGSDYKSDGSYGGTPTHKSPEIPKRMNVRYRMTNYMVEDGGIPSEIKEAEARKKEMQSIKARLNKIAEIEIYRKEQFRNELKKLEENRRKEEEDTKRKSSEDFTRRKKLEEKKKLVDEFRRNRKTNEEIEQMKIQQFKKDAENKRKINNENKKKKLAEFYTKKQELLDEIDSTENDY